jgi:hypothetical protein
MKEEEDLKSNDTGKLTQEDQIYPGCHQPTQPLIKFNARQALRLMFVAMIIYVIATLISAIVNIYLSSIEGYYYYPLTPLVLYNALSYILFFCFAVILMISIFFFGRDTEFFNAKHSKNIKWAIYFTIVFVILGIITWVIDMWMIMGTQNLSTFMTALTSKHLLALIRSLILVFIIFLPVSQLAGKREQDKMYLFASVIIIAIIFRALIMAVDISFRYYELRDNFLIIYALFDLVIAGMWILAATVYLKIWNWMKVYGYEIPRESLKFLPRPKQLSKLVYNFYSRPMRALLVILVIAILLSATEGGAFYIRFYRHFNPPDPVVFEEDNEPVHIYFEETWTLTEGESKVYEYPIDGNVQYIYVTLTWTDEPDELQRTNEPDCFSLSTYCSGIDNSDSTCNDNNGNGEIFLPLTADGGFWGTADISITLDQAGDQMGPSGLPFGPMVVQDNENMYTMNVELIGF